MIAVIDNNDSFTYNLIDYFKVTTEETIKIFEVDQLTIEQLNKEQPDAIVISPGPGQPKDYPVLFQVMKHFSQNVPILGVCLGFQLIFEYYGGEIVNGPYPVHGHTTLIKHNRQGIFANLPKSFHVIRYHSLIGETSSLPNELAITARNEEDIIMAVQHTSLPIYAVQYHPESILSEHGHAQIKQFLIEAGVTTVDCAI